MSVPEKMKAGAETFEQRNRTYGDAYKKHGAVMMALFPEGVTLKTEEDVNRWCLVNAVIGKMIRYSASFDKGGHKDSAHDMGVYGFMLEDFDENCGR